MAEIHPDWDQAKVRAHLHDLRAKRDRLQIIADAFQEAAEDAYRAVRDQEVRRLRAKEAFARPRQATS
jgi:hypothetical protein